MAVSFKFLQELPSKFEIQCKKGIYFSFDFGWFFINFDIVHALRTGWGRGGWLNQQTKSVKHDKS